MTFISTITQKGQITLPASIRKRWRLKPRQKVMFIEKGNVVEVKRSVDFFSLRGSITRKRIYSDMRADRTVGKYLAHEYGKKKKDN